MASYCSSFSSSLGLRRKISSSPFRLTHHHHHCSGRCSVVSMKTASTASAFPTLTIHSNNNSSFQLEKEQRFKSKSNAISHDKLEEWVHNSVTEIVKNIEEAPFLMYVYSSPSPSPSPNDTTPVVLLKREKAVADNWPFITRRWELGSPIPDGVILVEQIDIQEQGEEEEEILNNNHHLTTTTATATKAWGLIIQGRGLDRAACYILKTCRVRSSCGVCTHFSLIRAKCFGDSPQLQLKNSWLIPNSF